MNRRANVFNIRPFFFGFLFFGGGVLAAYGVRQGGVSPFWLLAALPLCFCLPLFQANLRRAFFLAALFWLLFFAGFLLYDVRLSLFLSFPLEEGGYLLSGKVLSKSAASGGFSYVIKLSSADGGEASAKLSLFSAEEFSCGDILTFRAALSYNDDFFAKGYFDVGSLPDNIRYTAEDVTVFSVKSGFSFFGGIRERMRDVIYTAMAEEEASVVYALLTGDTSGAEEGFLASVRYGGIAHLFAVSGLHIGVLYSSVRFVFARLGAPRAWRSGVCISLSVLYAGVCAFSPSSVRAVVMCALLDLSFYVAARGDFLERIGVAGLALLAFQPFYLFSVGFQMSFGACIGIALLCRPLKSVFARVGLKGKIGDLLSLSLSVNLFLLPIMLDAFSYVSVWGLLLNIVLVPLLSALFAPLLLLVLLSCVFPVLAPVLLFAPQYVFRAVYSLFVFFDFSAPVLSGFSFGLAKIPYYAGMCAAGDKINVKTPLKILLCLILGILVVFVIQLNGA